ncbi:hypothetical protein [uncultured Sunxiuqinia sp.]|uniref:hypothetical protein n=1 Tax=uncultured Sunxiuqinia sp. TaxID=1573825 RepID=UPI002AA6DEB7|nr:hypothetical protein [uncultured Sunxiuqinia sp.]
MMKIIIIGIAFLFMNQVYGQECNCIDNSFSSKNDSPIAFSKIGNEDVAFCGYKYDEIGKLKSDSSFIGCGYEIILCSEKKSIFEVGEFYTDSIKIRKNGFDIFRTENFPYGQGEKYNEIPVLKFSFSTIENKIQIDTIFAIPDYYISNEYFKKLELIIETIKKDTGYPTRYPDFNLHYLFLKAVSDKKFERKFIDSGPYDGYLAVIYRNFVEYLSNQNE